MEDLNKKSNNRKKANVDFSSWKKTQMHIQKTERFANIEFGLISSVSFQFKARKPEAPDER